MRRHRHNRQQLTDGQGSAAPQAGDSRIELNTEEQSGPANDMDADPGRRRALRTLGGLIGGGVVGVAAGAEINERSSRARHEAEIEEAVADARRSAEAEGYDRGVQEGMRVVEGEMAQAVEDARALDDEATNSATDYTLTLLRDGGRSSAILATVFRGILTVESKSGVQRYSNPLVLAGGLDVKGNFDRMRFGICQTNGSNQPATRAILHGRVTAEPSDINDEFPYDDVMLYSDLQPSVAPDGTTEGKGTRVAMAEVAETGKIITPGSLITPEQ